MLLVAVMGLTALVVVRLILGVLRLAVSVLVGVALIVVVLVPLHAALGVPFP